MELAGIPVKVISSNLTHIEFVTPEFQIGEPILSLISNRGFDSILLLLETDNTIYFIPKTYHLNETSTYYIKVKAVTNFNGLGLTNQDFFATIYGDEGSSTDGSIVSIDEGDGEILISFVYIQTGKYFVRISSNTLDIGDHEGDLRIEISSVLAKFNKVTPNSGISSGTNFQFFGERIGF